jgi:hypothetical protein
MDRLKIIKLPLLALKRTHDPDIGIISQSASPVAEVTLQAVY